MSEDHQAQPSPGAAKTLQNLRFLVVDDYADGRYLVSKTLLRKFPHCVVLECQTAEAAFDIIAKQVPTFIIAHRTVEFDGISLIHELRKRAPDLPILLSSGIDRGEAATRAGADGVITYDEWLLVGNRVLEVLAQRRAGINFPLG